jgi:hypothetical protein
MDRRSVAEAQPPERPEPAWASGERQTLVEFMNYQRDTLERQAFALTDAQGATASVEPSMLTMTGLVRHLTDVERNWFRRCFAGQDAPPLYYDDIRPDGDLEVDATMSLRQAVAGWRHEIEICDQILAAVADMAALSIGRSRDGNQPNMRWIMVHMIEEYARHCGHADLIRERLDGATDL